MDLHAVSELYQHVLSILIAGVTIGAPIFVLLWRISWKLSRVAFETRMMWRAFCLEHKIDPNGKENGE